MKPAIALTRPDRQIGSIQFSTFIKDPGDLPSLCRFIIEIVDFFGIAEQVKNDPNKNRQQLVFKCIREAFYIVQSAHRLSPR